MKLEELYQSQEEVEKFLYEMANIRDKQTGIPNIILWAGQAPPGAKRHSPRVKVCSRPTSKVIPEDFFTLSIQEEPQIKEGECYLSTDQLQDVKDWISRNKEVLLKYWNGELYTDEFLELLVKV